MRVLETTRAKSGTKMGWLFTAPPNGTSKKVCQAGLALVVVVVNSLVDSLIPMWTKNSFDENSRLHKHMRTRDLPRRAMGEFMVP